MVYRTTVSFQDKNLVLLLNSHLVCALSANGRKSGSIN